MLYWIRYEAFNKYKYASKDLTLMGFDRSVCPECGREVATAQYKENTPHLRLEGGRVFPDFLQFCDAGNRMFMVSEKVLEMFEKNGITGYSGYQLMTYEFSKRKSSIIEHPNYYSLNITGKVDLDLAEMHLKKKRLCPQCGQFDWSRMRFGITILDETTWNGSDLCFLDSIPGFKLCSEKVKELIQQHKFTNFSFKPEIYL